MTGCARKHLERHHALLSDDIAKDWHHAISRGRPLRLFVPRLISDVFERHECRFDWRIQDRLAGPNPIGVRFKWRTMSRVIPGDFRFLPFEPVEIAVRLASGCIYGIALVNRCDWYLVVVRG